MVNLKFSVDDETGKAFKKKLIDDDLKVSTFVKLCIDLYLRGDISTNNQKTLKV